MKLIIISFLILSSAFVDSKFRNHKSTSNSHVHSKHKHTQFVNPDAVTYGYARGDDFALQNAAGFKDAQIIPRIPIHLNHPYTGIMAEANTYVNDKFYYNGSDNLNAVHVNCNIYTTNPQGCVHNSKCGWCGEKNSCVPGNTNGPLAPCLRSTFLYTTPTPEWNPMKAGTVNILTTDTKGQPQTRLTWEPNMNKVDVYNPYQ